MDKAGFPSKTWGLCILSLLACASAQGGPQQVVGPAANNIDQIKVNVGGPDLVDIAFLSDQPSFYKSSTGDAKAYEDPIAPAVPLNWGEVYRSHRYAEGGVLSYTFPVPEGSFSIGLMFVEQFDGVALPGGRVFDLFVNDELLESGIDVWTKAGGKLYEPVYLEKSEITPIAGFISISLVPVTENPMLSGIVIEGPRAASLLRPNATSGSTNSLTSEPAMTRDPRPLRQGLSAPTPDSATLPEQASSPVESLVGSENNLPNTTSEAITESSPSDLTPSPLAGEDAADQQPSTPSELVGSGTWNNVPYSSGAPVARHEACSVFADGLIYLIGGRGMKPVSVYDPVAATWSSKTGPPAEINHMQCVFYDGKIFIGGSWYGKYPFEKEHVVTWVYEIKTDTWSERKGLPVGRRRGGGAFVLYEDKLYLSHGAIGGHGAHATSTGLLDVYDPATDEWSALPDGPMPRDHTGGAVIGGKFCVAGGRDGGQTDFWNANVGPIVCYTFASRSWEVRASLPVPRGGAMVGATCGGLLMIAGGEGKTPQNQAGQAFDRVDLYDDSTNSFLKPSYMTSRRHGSGLAVTSCNCGNIYVPSGSAGLGGGPEVTSSDVWSPDGTPRVCT